MDWYNYSEQSNETPSGKPKLEMVIVFRFSSRVISMALVAAVHRLSRGTSYKPTTEQEKVAFDYVCLTHS